MGVTHIYNLLVSENEVKMEKFECKDMGMNCDFVAMGSSVEEVKNKAMAHAQEVHGDMLKSMTTPTQMAEMEKALSKAIKHVA